MAILPYTKSSQIFSDPSSRSNEPNSRYNNPAGGTVDMPSVFNYGVNFYVMSNGNTATTPVPARHTALFKQPTMIPMVADSGPLLFNWELRRVFNSNHNENPNGYPSTNTPVEAWARHLNGSNLLFCDGHAKFYPQSALVEDPARMALYPSTNAKERWFKIPLTFDDDRVQ
jgi:prepilin-type processing-associated H-X9-DG protein